MSFRPQFASRSPSRDAPRSGAPSPRVEHFDGEIPPALSPLDAFAAQGRLLARQLEESARRDRRMSRLPPASVARSLSQPRPGYFRSPSSGDSSQGGGGGGPPGISRQPTQKARPEVEEPKFRPQSEHPRLSAISNFPGESNLSNDEDATPKNESPVLENEGFAFDAVRAESPEEDMSIAVEGPRRYYAPSPVGYPLAGPSMNSSTDSASRLNIPRGLAPPVSPMSRPSSSSRGTQPESSDDDYSSSNAGSTFSKPRKLSSSSAMSLPYSPMSTMARSHPRSPSISSEASNTGGNLSRPSYNFSRPLSRSSTSLSAPAKTPTSDHAHSLQSIMNRSNKPNPIVVPTHMDLSRSLHEDPSSVSSYIYAKYALPRGRVMSRDSIVFSGLQTPHFEWQEPLFESPERPRTAEPQMAARTPSPSPSRQESIASRKPPSVNESPAPENKILTPQKSASPSQNTLTPEKAQPEHVPPRAQSSETTRTEDHLETTSSADSASTLRPQTTRTAAPSAVISAEEHVTKGIECHERGSLNESTYHLRIAAKQDHPVGMLLYALACRHGWGMRPNQREGVRWLRKAMDSVGLELLDESNAELPAKARELQKTYRAQFALSVYELGVSHLNGWGIEQDKTLALRCFETAARWGDADALAEAGYCYAEGIGCKKDLKKAAKYYRQAEAKGMSMVGNSWIYKDKYMSDDEPNTRSRGRQASNADKKQRSKSRTRSLFQRKRSNATEA
ncbi:hypothetical protein ARAM_004306 [Aspergillus rambellii]|uniref:Cell cycle inhibitor Nif1 n=1 Tax=Aspergillus rambellii TaxID=308745 RepID=A0A0F8UGU3_9EURO|nr:hypothetical protein ARAM_004306 [Aspergillus rambellii]